MGLIGAAKRLIYISICLKFHSRGCMQQRKFFYGTIDQNNQKYLKIKILYRSILRNLLYH